MSALGATLARGGDGAGSIDGVGIGGLAEPEEMLDLGNSGTAARLLMGLVAAHDITAFFTGGIMVIQSGIFIRRFGAYGLLGFGAGYATLREVGPILIGLMFSGRVGANNAAELGTMTVTEQLDPNLDWTTFRLGQLGFGDTVIQLPADAQNYSGEVTVTIGGSTVDVQLEAGIDLASGLVTATFQSIDPATSLPPSVLIGFLPPEDGTGAGKGYFSYTVRPKPGLPTGTQIRNVALISFDGQPQIATDQVNDQDPTAGTDPSKEALATIDSAPPTSRSSP